MSFSTQPFHKQIFHYWFFSKATLLVLGLVLGYKIVDYSVMSFLIDYLSEAWDEKALIYKVAIVNTIEGLSDIMVLVLACLADDLTGRYLMVINSATLYIMGLLLYLIYDWQLSPSVGTLIFLLSVPLLASGKGGDYNLTEFLANQLRAGTDNHDEQNKDNTVEVRKQFWLLLLSFCSALLLYFYFGDVSWRLTFLITVLVLGIALLFFPMGKMIYNYEETAGSPAYNIYRVLKASLLKQNLPWSEEDEDVKRLLALTPIVLSFFLYSFAKAAGSTFFIEQISNMHAERYALYALVIIQLFSKFLTSMFSKLYERFMGQGSRQRGGAGIICSFTCCLVAYVVESQRLELIQKYKIVSNPDEIISMSAYWLSPQFFLLGSMIALAESGLEYLIYSRMKTEKMKRYTEPFSSCILGIGKLISMLLVIVCGKWFNTTVNDSRLDKYYLVLSFTSLMNIFLYYLLLKKFGSTRREEQTDSQSQNEREFTDVNNQNTERQNEVILHIGLSQSCSTRPRWSRSWSTPINDKVPLIRLGQKGFIRLNTTL